MSWPVYVVLRAIATHNSRLWAALPEKLRLAWGDEWLRRYIVKRDAR